MSAILNAYVSNFSENFNAAVLLWPLFSAFLTLPILVFLYRRDGWLRLSAIFIVYAAILYLVGLACFTLYPLPSGDSGPGITYGIPPILDPLNFIRDISNDGASAVFQLLFNIVFFMPLGFIVKVLLKLDAVPAFLICLLATSLIETAQLTGLFGLYPFAFRTFDVDDIICNTLGGMLGWLLGLLATRTVLREPDERPEITHSAGLGRRLIALWTDAMIIDVCCIVIRAVLIAGLGIIFGRDPDVGAIQTDRINEMLMLPMFVVAFIVVEVVIPWRHDGCTPAGMFYRMSFEMRKRTGANRAIFYAARSAMIFLLLLFPKYLLIPFAAIFLIMRKMPYDLIASDDEAVGIEAPDSEAS